MFTCQGGISLCIWSIAASIDDKMIGFIALQQFYSATKFTSTTIMTIIGYTSLWQDHCLTPSWRRTSHVDKPILESFTKSFLPGGKWDFTKSLMQQCKQLRLLFVCRRQVLGCSTKWRWRSMYLHPSSLVPVLDIQLHIFFFPCSVASTQACIQLSFSNKPTVSSCFPSESHISRITLFYCCPITVTSLSLFSSYPYPYCC